MSESLCKGLQVSLCKGLNDGGGRARFDPEKKKKRFLPRGPGERRGHDGVYALKPGR